MLQLEVRQCRAALPHHQTALSEEFIRHSWACTAEHGAATRSDGYAAVQGL